MKPKPLTPEQIRDAARIDDRKGAVELQKALTKMARNFSKMTLDQLLEKIVTDGQKSIRDVRRMFLAAAGSR